MNSLADSVAVVTGASRGIGLAIAEVLRESGCRVARLARGLRDEHGDRFTDFRCDVTDEKSVRDTVDRLIRDVGIPDIVVNNAGAFLLKPLLETSKQEFEAQLAVNLVGAFLVVRAFLPHLVRRGRGRVVTIGSVADYRAFPGNAAYGASKHGLRAFHDVLQVEIAGTGVSATLISPGPTDTRLWDALDLDRREDLPTRASMLRPDDIGEAVLFTVSRPDRVNVDVLRLQPTR